MSTLTPDQLRPIFLSALRDAKEECERCYAQFFADPNRENAAELRVAMAIFAVALERCETLFDPARWDLPSES